MELDTDFVSGLGVNAQMRSSLLGSSDAKIEYKSDEVSITGYGLRENPKKTWRAEDLKTHPLISEQIERFCKQCGKGFRSMKALCGHMACHSEKDRFLKDDDSWTSDEAEREDKEIRNRPKRANTMKRKNCSIKSSSVFDSGNSIDFEQEEVAMCLMMLSKDDRNCYDFGSNQESSDSVVLETKSSSIDMKSSQQRDRDCAYESVEAKKLCQEKLKSSVYEESIDGYIAYNDYEKQDKRKGAESGIGLSKGEELDKNEKCQKIMKSVVKNKKKKNLKVKKKTKGHECPYCKRVFKSGQALGGHKRSHFMGNSGNRNKVIASVCEPETSKAKDLLDLNLPAPEEEDESEHSQYLNW